MEADPLATGTKADGRPCDGARRYTSTAAGRRIALVAADKSWPARLCWIAVYACSLLLLTLLVACLVTKYLQGQTRVDSKTIRQSELPFPAVTVCNQNPYKRSAVSSNTVMMKAQWLADNARRQRSTEVVFEVAMSKCVCEGREQDMNCEADKVTKPADATDVCLCAFDRHAGDAWPCFPLRRWHRRVCHSCNEQGMCNEDAESDLGTTQAHCMCQDINDFCVMHDGSDILDWESEQGPLKLWEYYSVDEDTKSNEDAALRFTETGMMSGGEVKKRARENVMYASSSLGEDERKRMSYSMEEFVRQCAFNGRDCDMQSDFRIHMDPVHGACFTFNHNQTKSSTTAGPFHGLRLALYVNVSDYLPTTETVGAKVVLHANGEYPFPDTFGYDVPTGQQSSFAVALEHDANLPPPYGDCVVDGKTDAYIYSGYKYSSEGCVRSCMQQLVMHNCGCADPRYPTTMQFRACYAADPIERKCLQKTQEVGGSFQCRCPEPCEQVTYTVASVSTISLLPVSWQSTDDMAVVQVFHQRLAHRLSVETETYGALRLLCDIGAAFALWLGVVAICELLFVAFQCIWPSHT